MSKEYDDYYKKLAYTYENGGGWSGFYYGVFSEIINKNNFKNCAEVGIGYGFHAKQILKNTDVSKLYLVDPMCWYENDGFPEDVVKFGGFETLVKNIKLHLEEEKDRYTWFRQPSTTITQEQIPDESLDAVFIDADHSYEAVSKDLRFWWNKLKKGGWLLGDDYSSCCHPGTKQAADEFARVYNLDMEFVYKPGTTYPIYKFVKNDTFFVL
jgi:hypothetical protein